MEKIIEELSAQFADYEIEWRVGSTNKDKTKGLMLAYVTNRAIMNRLDSVVGAQNWKQSFKEIHKGIICSLSIRFTESGEWITKEDGADLTDIEPTKGGLSDSMKRAAVQFGIGRYLYDSISEWVELKDGKYPVRKPTAVKLKATPERQLSTEEAFTLLRQASTLDELKEVYMSLSASLQRDTEVVALKDELKNNLK